MAVAKRQEGKSQENRAEEGPRTGEGTSGRMALGLSPICIGQSPGEGKSIQRDEPKRAPHPRAHAIRRSSLHVFGSTCPHSSKMDFPAII